MVREAETDRDMTERKEEGRAAPGVGPLVRIYRYFSRRRSERFYDSA